MGKVTISVCLDADLVAWANANAVDPEKAFVDELTSLVEHAKLGDSTGLVGYTFSDIAERALLKAKSKAVAPEVEV